MKHQVTGCKDCPLFNNGSDYEYRAICLHPLAPRQFYEKEFKDEEVFLIEVDEDYSRKPTNIPVTPTWCPLKQEEITIELIP